MAKSPPNTVQRLIRMTVALRRDLEKIIELYPENHLERGQQILGRLLDPRWRRDDESYPPNTKEADAIAWIRKYKVYIETLEGYFCDERLDRETFLKLPFNGTLVLSAEECVRKLIAQEKALRGIIAAAGPSIRPTRRRADSLDLQALQRAADRFGIDSIAVEAGLNRDTVADALAGRVHPNKKTRDKLIPYIARIKNPAK